jgi:hypothetical protein
MFKNGVRWSEVEWSEVEWSVVEWSEVEWSEVEWSEVEWSGVEWSGVEWSEVEWSEAEWSGVRWSGVEWSEVEWGEVGWSEVEWSYFFVVSVRFIYSYEWVSLHSMWLQCLDICPHTVCSISFVLSYASFPSNYYYPFYLWYIALHVLLSILCVLWSVFFLLMYIAALCFLYIV